MEPSLSVILPVHNAESILASQIDELLDVLPEMSLEFEIVVVDDASTDATEEVALELKRQFPQLKFVRRTDRGGLDEAVGEGLPHCQGEIVFVHEAGGAVNVASLVRLWKLRRDEGLVMARTDPPSRALDFSVVRKLNTAMKKSAATQTATHGGIQMIRRDAVETLAQEPEPTRRLRFANLTSQS